MGGIMVRRGFVLIVLSSALGLLFATWLQPPQALGNEVPSELQRDPAHPTREAKQISRPIIEATAKVRPSVVEITRFIVDRAGGVRRTGTGSGFIVSSQGHILTNRHVLQDGAVFIVELADGRRFERTKVLGEDPRSDIAVLQIDQEPARPLPVVELGDSDALEVGELVVAIGAPNGLESSVSLGIVSATGRAGLIGVGASEEFIQTDAALNPGNSGGPLINLDGQVVGINTAIDPNARAGGIGFTIPINLARTVAMALIERGVARRGRLGIRPDADRALTSSQLREMGIDASGGIRLSLVEPDSPAAKAGLLPGDVITAVDGRPLKDLRILHARLAQAGPGGVMRITFHRDGKQRMVAVTLDEERIQSFGIVVSSLDVDGARSLGLPSDAMGAVVTRIEDDSVAGRADARNRLMPGDVIERIDWARGQRYVRNERDFDTVMTELQANPPTAVRFVIRTKAGRFAVILQP
jgi:serine protease Do